MERLSEKIIQYMIKNSILSEDDKEIYAFGLTQMIRALSTIITTIFIGFCFGKIIESIVFVVFTALIRTNSGGYHSDSPVGCYFISVISIIITLYLVGKQVFNVRLMVVLLAVSFVVFIKYAPIGHVNKMLDKMEESTYKRRLLWILLTIAFVEIVFVVVQKLYLFSAGGYACIFSMLMLIVGKYRLNRFYNI
nr:accessory gene regulator B family protein [uncultured Lachnoanaerobaculum sp.]